MKFSLLTLAFVTFFSSVSSANYLKTGLGVSISGDTTFKSAAGDLEEEHKVMIAFPMLVAYGYQLTDFLALEGELSLRTTNYKSQVMPNSINSNNVAVNAVFSLPQEKAWNNINVFVGLGAAYGQYALGAGTKKELGLGAQAFIGADYTLSSNVRVGIEYRYFQTVQDIDLGNGIEAEFNNSSAVVSAKFPF